MSAEVGEPADLTELVERLARARGIGDAYHSYKGELKRFTLTTKAAILRAMHCRVDDAAALVEQIRESESALPAGLLGDVVVLRMGEKFEVLATNTLADQVFIATPAIMDGAIYLRGQSTLFCVR